MVKEKVILSWSGGKDSAFSLYELQKAERYEVVCLLTTVTQGYDRISMHGVRRILLEQQANALSLPLEMVYISKDASNAEYESKMEAMLKQYRSNDVFQVAFGDIFLEDLRQYRETKLSQVGMRGIFPIWKKDTKELAEAFVRLGFRAVITCVDSTKLDGSFSGRFFDAEFLRDLPSGVDPCGENGEFHSFVFDGPIFKEPIPFSKGEVVARDNRFYFCDLIPRKRKVSV